jgi:hypothetical protein
MRLALPAQGKIATGPAGDIEKGERDMAWTRKPIADELYVVRATKNERAAAAGSGGGGGGARN